MSRADELANWLVGNKDKKGTPEWDAKAEEYKRAADAEEAERKVPTGVQGERDTERLKILATEYFKEMQRFKQGAKDALDNLKSLGREITAAGGQAPALPEAQEAAAAPEETDEQREARMDSERMAYEERMGQMFGGGAGAGLTAARLSAEGGKSLLRGAGQAISQGMAAGAPAGPVGGPAAPVGGPAAPASPRAPGAMPSSVPAGPTSPVKPLGGSMSYNYAISGGLPDIEARAALDMTKQPGGAQGMIAQRSQAFRKAQELFPGRQFTESDVGVMRMSEPVGGVPRESTRYTPTGIAGQVAPPAPPKPPSGLEQVTKMFRDMAGRGLQTAQTVANPLLRYAAPPLALATAGGELARGAEEYRKEAPDYGEMALSGLGALGGVLSAFPATAPVGIPISLGVPAYRAVREKVAAEPPVAPMTPEEEIMYRRPSFRISAPKSRGLQ